MALWRSKARAAATVAGSPRRRLELTGKETREYDAELGNRADVFGTGPQCAASIARFVTKTIDTDGVKPSRRSASRVRSPSNRRAR